MAMITGVGEERVRALCRHLEPVRVRQVFIYPIKSCGAIERKSAKITRAGLEYDRQFAIVDEDGDVLSQKQHPRLAVVRPSLRVANGLLVAMTLTFGGPEDEDPPLPITIHVADVGEAVPRGERRKTRWVGCRHDLLAEVYPECDQWLSRVLGTRCSLCRLDQTRRLMDCRLAPVSKHDDECRYHDGAPLTVVSQASIDLLNSRLPPECHVDAYRFRPNLVLDGCAAHEEDTWVRLRVGCAVIRTLMEDYRCTMVTVEQKPGRWCGRRPHGRVVQNTLEQYRSVTSAEELTRGSPCLAVFATLDGEEPDTFISVNDGVTILERINSDDSSLYLHNVKAMGYDLRLNTDRFWETR